MWTVLTEKLQNEKVIKYYIMDEREQLTWTDVLKLWQGSDSFCTYFSALLNEAPFDAFFWECPPLTLHTLASPFEFVLVDSSQLKAVTAEVQTFSRYFTPAEKFVCDFVNLGGDAHLLAPLPITDKENYTHLARFVRYAPAKQQTALWQRLAILVEEKISQEPLWLSTSGLGVYWLHIRLDTRPKYYQFIPYRNS